MTEKNRMTEENREVEEKSDNDYDRRRREALAEIDNAKFGWFHIRTCIVADYVYYGKSSLPSDIDLSLKVATPIGTFIDVWHRVMIILISTLAICLVANSYVYDPNSKTFVSNASVISAQGLMLFWRILLCIGIGGDYPLSAIIASEFATTKRRGAMIATVFAMQGFGILTAAITSTMVVVAFHSGISTTNYASIDYVWRIVTGIGAVPAFIALYYRLTIPDSPRYTMDIECNINIATTDMSTAMKYCKYQPHEEEVIIKVDASKPNIAFYGISLNNNIILQSIGFLGDGKDPYKASVGNIIVTMLGTVPGYWITVFLINIWGRRPIQLMGFALFSNFGPNATTFVVPGEVFPTRYCSTGHGISAASGKLGAIISQVGFFKLKDIGGAPGSNAFMNWLFVIFAIFMFSGLIVTYFCVPETKNLSLEDLSNEDQEGFVKGLATTTEF
ncbi:1873_t:CDS:2, partial [Gigaspora rosea]